MQRLESVAVGTEGTTWHTLVDKPYTLQNGVVLYPLTSRADLRVEADAMHHCVWSYTNYCINDAYHIFSARTVDGERLSTLTVRDYMNASTGTRQVKRLYNLSFHDKSPPKKAIEAEQLFVAAINAGEIKSDWDSIDKSKDIAAANALKNSTGYDIRDPQKREDVLGVYRPCLPRNVSSKVRQFDDVIKFVTPFMKECGVIVDPIVHNRAHRFE